MKRNLEIHAELATVTRSLPSASRQNSMRAIEAAGTIREITCLICRSLRIAVLAVASTRCPNDFMTILLPVSLPSDSGVNPHILPDRAFLRMPEYARLRLARFTIWRRRRARVIKTSTLTLLLACLSGVLGFVLAQPPTLFEYDNSVPKLASALPVQAEQESVPVNYPTASAWGELQAEVLRLRALFGRVAEAAKLDEGEFALAMQVADERYLDAISAVEDVPETAAERFMLAKRAVNHMTDQAQLMLGISQRREQARRFTLSGTPAVRARISSLYGFRSDPGSGKQQFHRGLDFGGAKGSKVLALADGVVTYAGKNGGYGNLVELEHANGYRTRYAHNEANLVAVGDKVDKKQAIALMGSTGRSTGTHVHVEVRLNGSAVDPLQFVRAGS